MRYHLLCSLPQVGDVVEYPLRIVETEDFNDGRSHGVGLLVGRNMDRGKATCFFGINRCSEVLN